jgi:hypothetical protein
VFCVLVRRLRQQFAHRAGLEVLAPSVFEQQPAEARKRAPLKLCGLEKFRFNSWSSRTETKSFDWLTVFLIAESCQANDILGIPLNRVNTSDGGFCGFPEQNSDFLWVGVQDGPIEGLEPTS